MSYARILAHYPYIVLLVVLVVVATCLIVSVTLGEEFAFEPLEGFEPRGTEISDRMVTYKNLIDNVGENANLLPFRHNKKETLIDRIKERTRNKKLKKKKKKPRNIEITKPLRYQLDNQTYLSDYDEQFFCSIPSTYYARVVFSSVDSSNLFSLEHIKSMCLHERHLHVHPPYIEKCIKPTGKQSCCRSWCLGNYIALLSNKSSCKHINDDDVTEVFNLLKSCAPFYQNRTMGPNCDYSPNSWFFDVYHDSQKVCSGIPDKCIHYNAVFHILYYLVDRQFIEDIVAGDRNPHLSYAMTFLPLTVSASSLDIYEYIESLPSEFNGVQIIAAKFDVKMKLFQKYLKSDKLWLGICAFAIFLVMWLFTTSVFITVMTFLSVFWALTLAYFLYMFVFEIEFFPYMNMVAVIVMMGIGADDLFIYCKVWNISKSEPNNGALEKIIGDTLRHATLSMLVTSLTTAASFYANCVGDVTAISCFSIYAGTAVMCNFLLTVTWIPATIMLHEKWCKFCSCYNPGVYTSEDGCCSALCKFPYKVYYLLCDWSRIFFEKLLPCLVIRLRYLWILLFGSLGVCGFFVIFYHPKLKLPSSNKFQMFPSDHWLEKYDIELVNLFAFEKMSAEEDVPFLPITIIWGVHATDTGDPLNPKKKGTLVFDDSFDLAEKESQKWVLQFCKRLRRTDFYLNTPGIQLTNCFLENFVHGYMQQSCRDNYPCCNQTKFPYSKTDFNHCMRSYVPLLQKTPSASYSSYSPGPRFSDGHISAFIVEFLSNEPYSESYNTLKQFYQHINRWMTDEMLQAPKSMRNGWFVSHLGFYDLQNSLAVGTPLALGVSLAVVAVVAFFTTLNILISLYAIITIMFIIVVTIASLVLQGWELNILESVIVTIAIGMSIDYTLHYGVAYRLSPDLDKEMRVACSVSQMGSAISMASSTTFLAGLFMMPSHTLVYRKFGIFLMILVAASWLYATFFFQSLLRIIGPQGGFSQFHWPAFDCCSSSSREHVDKTVYALSESTLSSSSTSNPNHMSSEIHELEPLKEEKEMECQSHRSSQQIHSYHHYHPHHRARTKGAYTHMKPKSSSDSNTGTDPKSVMFEPISSPRSPEVILEQPEMEQSDSRKTSTSSHPNTESFEAVHIHL